MCVFKGIARGLRENGGCLYLAEVNNTLRAQLERTGTLAEIGEENILPEGERMYASLRRDCELA